jgi:hypothetical protein
MIKEKMRMPTYSFFLGGLTPSADKLWIAFLLRRDDPRLGILQRLSKLGSTPIRQKGHDE